MTQIITKSFLFYSIVMDTDHTIQDEIDYIKTDSYGQNLKNQKELFEQLFHVRHSYDYPFEDWNGFLYHYSYVRAGLSSLSKNPDTQNDPDFKELCSTWRRQKLGSFDFDRLEELYNRLSRKPVFSNNYIFKELYGHFVKSIYQLLTEGYYTHRFFELDG